MNKTFDSIEIKPISPICALNREIEPTKQYEIGVVSAVVGMTPTFIHRVVGKKSFLPEKDVILLLEQDAFGETFVPRSKVLDFLRGYKKCNVNPVLEINQIRLGDALNLIKELPDNSIQAVVTSSPYWAMRMYDEIAQRVWADGEACAFGLESTPEGFIRHSVEVLFLLKDKLKTSGSVWWNIMDSYNTRTQLRSNAAEALKAMQGKENRLWKEYKYKRYSAGHSYLKDGEQCLIPQRILERASRIGYYCKSCISWCKTSCMPEPQNSRVSRNVEYVLHLSVDRAPTFNKNAYLSTPAELGGRQSFESEKLSDFWYLPTSAGRDGHGAQFPLQLPGRCIALSSNEGDVILDPFLGSGTTAAAAALLNRSYIGFEVCQNYVEAAKRKLNEAFNRRQLF